MARQVKSLLLAVGPNDHDHVTVLLDEAIGIAEPTGATVYLLHVFPREEYNDLLSEMDVEPTTGQLPPDELAVRHESIRTPAGLLEKHGIDYAVRGIIGNPAREIVHLAEEIDVDRVLLGGAKRSPAGKAVFGDHAQQVLLNAPCPVTYIQRD
ncbi:universal stress protein [Halomarina halobia]|uniref:Universal stress protein n=1 Tax=Halomarina halobia TaxID=3033386 RepID=A0ABD6ACX5_9EURY|nr:universal stress protein [Halomarina sp. PSR21]